MQKEAEAFVIEAGNRAMVAGGGGLFVGDFFGIDPVSAISITVLIAGFLISAICNIRRDARERREAAMREARHKLTMERLRKDGGN